MAGSWVLLTEAALLGLLVCEPIVAAHTSGGVSAEYLLVSNVMGAVALPFVLLLAVGESDGHCFCRIAACFCSRVESAQRHNR